MQDFDPFHVACSGRLCLRLQGAEGLAGKNNCLAWILVILFYQFAGYPVPWEDEPMQMPTPDASVLARKSRIVARLLEVLPKTAVIHEEAETKAYECDALTAYKCPPLAAILPPSSNGKSRRDCIRSFTGAFAGPVSNASSAPSA